jgi:hypothetical protein
VRAPLARDARLALACAARRRLLTASVCARSRCLGGGRQNFLGTLIGSHSVGSGLQIWPDTYDGAYPLRQIVCKVPRCRPRQRVEVPDIEVKIVDFVGSTGRDDLKPQPEGKPNFEVVTKQPEHGTVETTTATNFPSYPKENIRSKCNEHRVRGVQVNYKSAEKYVGSDELELLIFFPGGVAWEVHYDISVR